MKLNTRGAGGVPTRGDFRPQGSASWGLFWKSGAMPEKQVTNRMRDADGRFAKGASGNPKERPRKGDSTAEVLRELLDQVKGGRTRREIIAEALLSKAEGGDVPAARTVIERVDGRSPYIIAPADLRRSHETDPDKLRIIMWNLRQAMPELAALLPHHEDDGE
jgi:Family of unknown function (DUF5681)